MEEAHDKDSNEELPAPRFKEIEEVFDKLDKVLVDADKIHGFSIFELEILMLMLNKKIQYHSLISTINFAGTQDGNENNLDSGHSPYK